MLLLPLINRAGLFLCDSYKCRRHALAFKGQRREDLILPSRIHRELSILWNGMRWFEIFSPHNVCTLLLNLQIQEEFFAAGYFALSLHCESFLLKEDHHHSFPNLPSFILLKMFLRCKNLKHLHLHSKLAPLPSHGLTDWGIWTL